MELGQHELTIQHNCGKLVKIGLLKYNNENGVYQLDINKQHDIEWLIQRYSFRKFEEK